MVKRRTTLIILALGEGGRAMPLSSLHYFLWERVKKAKIPAVRIH